MLIPFLYATSPRIRSLKPVRVPSDQKTWWRLPFHFPLIKDKNSLFPYTCQIDIDTFLDLKWDKYFRRDAVHVRQGGFKNLFLPCLCAHRRKRKIVSLKITLFWFLFCGRKGNEFGNNQKNGLRYFASPFLTINFNMLLLF